MSLDQARAVAAAMRARRGVPVTLDQRRAGFEAAMAAQPLPERARFTPDVNGLWVNMSGCDPGRVIIWLHGGAFVIGSPASYRAFGARLAAAAHARVLLLDYPLAPEKPFPAALDFTIAALDAAQNQRLIIGGDSAGANLAVAALQARAGVADACLLLSPYLDLTHSGASVAMRADRDSFVDVATMPATATTYLGDADPRDPRASPLLGAVDRFPPTLIQFGSEEVLADDSLRFAERLRAAGRSVVTQEWAGMMHCWPIFADQIDEGQAAIDQMGTWVRNLR